jgi:hypothetical protein
MLRVYKMGVRISIHPRGIIEYFLKVGIFNPLFCRKLGEVKKALS